MDTATTPELIPVSPWKRKKRPVVTETVPLPELGTEVTLRNLDTLLTSAAKGEIDVLLAEYVLGDDAEGEPTLYSAEDGEEYELNEALITDLCYLRQMQVADKRFSFDWWLGVALHCEEEYILISQAAQRLNRALPRRAGGNSPATGSASS